MSRFEVGPATLLIPDRPARLAKVSDMNKPPNVVEANQFFAAVSAPGGVLIEVVQNRWSDGGLVEAISLGSSPPEWSNIIQVFPWGKSHKRGRG